MVHSDTEREGVALLTITTLLLLRKPGYCNGLIFPSYNMASTILTFTNRFFLSVTVYQVFGHIYHNSLDEHFATPEIIMPKCNNS